MIIYPDEASIADLINANATASIILNAELTDTPPEDFLTSFSSDRIEELAKRYPKVDNWDLAYGSAILLTAGVNRNDEVFLRDEIYKATASIVDKPFNEEHKRDEIIGHVYDVDTLNSKREVIKITDDNIDDLHELLIRFVIYKRIRPDLTGRILNLIAAGRTFVSIEATGRDFDFALIKDNSIEIIKRTPETAFLSKYLRIFKGKGVYNGNRIGRVLRDFIFVGVGNVKKPANPYSDYVEINANAVYNSENIYFRFSYNNEGSTMTIETMEQAQAAIAELNAKVESLTSQNAELTSKVAALEANLVESTSAIESNKSELAIVQAALEAEKAKVAVSESKILELTTESIRLTAELESRSAELAKATEALSAYEKEKKVACRMEQVAKAGLAVTDELKATIAGMSDDSFNTVLAFMAKLPKPEVNVQATADLETEEEDTFNAEAAAGEPVDAPLVSGAKKLAGLFKKNRENVKNAE